MASAAAGAGQTALGACHLPTSDEKSGASFLWRLAVRQDSPQQTTMLFVSGSSRALCTADRGAEGSFWAATIGLGGDPSPLADDDALTYETGSGPSGGGGQYPTTLAVGRMPRVTARIEAVTSDGDRHHATLGDGWYMVWADATANDAVVEIDAFDSTGKVIASLKNPNGVDAGARATPG